ncbi:hypothetical protein F2P81_020504 [Scophthalmus maximus]|uniref:Uncharacterized protein n=1 Tax=Scophthalmus maximus TaxID=52904 RepID=A0A6A4S064_SCOMX|nr:hypothetical protein F2P81_020504 [Scophthalmus maximus]
MLAPLATELAVSLRERDRNLLFCSDTQIQHTLTRQLSRKLRQRHYTMRSMTREENSKCYALTINFDVIIIIDNLEN